MPVSEVFATVSRLLNEGQTELLRRSTERLRTNTVACRTLEEVGAAVEAGKFALYAWDLDPEFEKIIKDRWKATTRCLPFDGQFTDELLPITDPKLHRVIVARAF
ncbi:MAG TPA: hypothetical protein PK765_02475 [bacterium]|nr:hypothetical protein [bacterium]